MRVHRFLWRLFAVPVLVLGLLLAGATFPALAFGLAAVACCLVASVNIVLLDQAHLTAREEVSRLGRTLPLVGVGTACAVGYLAIAGVGGLVLVLVVLATSPVVARALSGLRRREGRKPLRWDTVVESLAYAAHDVAVARPPSPLAGLTDERLCQVWTKSSLALSAAPSTERTASLVEDREAYLEEMERRNLTGVVAWMVAGETSGSDLLSFLAQRDLPMPDVDWDHLIS